MSHFLKGNAVRLLGYIVNLITEQLYISVPDSSVNLSLRNRRIVFPREFNALRGLAYIDLVNFYPVTVRSDDLVLALRQLHPEPGAVRFLFKKDLSVRRFDLHRDRGKVPSFPGGEDESQVGLFF